MSDDSHPFYGEEDLGLAITTTEWTAATPIRDDAWVQGGLPRPSYIKPWQPTLLKHAEVIDAFGLLRADVVDDVAEKLAGLIGV